VPEQQEDAKVQRRNNRGRWGTEWENKTRRQKMEKKKKKK
jgi:hypothetical protein